MGICDDCQVLLPGTVSGNKDVHNEQTRIIIRSSAALKLNIGDLMGHGNSTIASVDKSTDSQLQEIVFKLATTSILASVVHIALHATKQMLYNAYN